MKQIADKIGVSVATYREWEYGRSIQSVERYVVIAEVLGVGLLELLSGKVGRHDSVFTQLDLIEKCVRQLRSDLARALGG